MKKSVFALLATICLAASAAAPVRADDDWHHRADINHDGRVDYHEWSSWQGHHHEVPRREWRSRFDSYDHDHDGYLAPAEVADYHR
ncbi:unnamed protein product [Sphagnum balticum]